MIWLLACTGTIEKTNETAEVIDETTDYAELSMDKIRSHLDALHQIAEENNDNRAVGTNGDTQTQTYIIQQLEAVGYDVSTEPVVAMGYQVLAEPIVSVGVDDFDAKVFYLSTSGDITANVSGVDLQIPPGASANSSTSGCESSDFDGFSAGDIALIQRGTCTFETKVNHAVNAGAAAVIIFNEGQQGRTEVVEGSLGDVESAVPVVGVSFQTGELLSQTTESVQVRVNAEVIRLETVNIFANPPGFAADTPNVLVGAHLDSVVAGPGINDNGSGTAVLLTLAEWMSSQTTMATTFPVRFAWWGAEEVGLIGSSAYVSAHPEELDYIHAYLNFDMLGSPNHAVFIYDGNGDAFGLSGPGISDTIEQQFQEYFNQQGIAYEATAFDGRSDYGPFIQAGVSAGGLFSGAESIKSSLQQSKFGGEEGVAFDKCYHQACDTIENIDWNGLEVMANAIVNVTYGLSIGQERVSQPIPLQHPIILKYQGHWLQY